ncbi:uncharacterized protein LTR77_007700 [Saxophila tyrrhenica]|uniref:AAA+ ATPase domain-containing protein n=1 Tax=Saxophila tyrrhenica TaxID=1690608 RepID=A0AAV9P3L1_9PEZI|nr:hypothetical protein LTR77_007700 [Saxophila tyrrhenica]
MAETYEKERAKYLQHLEHDSGTGATNGAGHAFETTPLFSLAVRHAGGKVDVEQVSELVEKRLHISNTPSDSRPAEPSVSSSSGGESDLESTEDNNHGNQPAHPHSNKDILSQYGLLGFHVGEHPGITQQEPILLNTRAPNSTFLCGSQGSGRSFTLACILENYLFPDEKFGSVANPVAGVAFHFDDDDALSGAEVASLCGRGVEVNVLVPSSNFHKLNAAYQKIAKQVGGRINVDRLLLRDEHLSISRMHKLMAFNESSDTGVPLYIAVINNTLHRMAIEGKPFKFADLERRLDAEDFMPAQRNLLNLRFNLLKSFLSSSALPKHKPKRDIFQVSPGALTIVDLSDPFIDASIVCTLFDMSLSLFKQNRPEDGLVITLDEAHKYLNNSAGAEKFTEHLITTIRMQRHHATRVVIATQEPTISGSLLDLCSVSMVHRFTSPAWFQAIKDHLSAASSLAASAAEQQAMFDGIVNLATGESFVFSPTSFVCVKDGKEEKLGTGVMKVKTRKREGRDLGRSKMAGGQQTATLTGI